ncbi:hypothetical protein PENTCL1PPCAC_10036, partial [Pristionchus entomophagus]
DMRSLLLVLLIVAAVSSTANIVLIMQNACPYDVNLHVVDADNVVHAGVFAQGWQLLTMEYYTSEVWIKNGVDGKTKAHLRITPTFGSHYSIDVTDGFDTGMRFSPTVVDPPAETILTCASADCFAPATKKGTGSKYGGDFYFTFCPSL